MNLIQTIKKIIKEEITNKNRKIEMIQHVVDEAIDTLKYICENLNTEDDEYVSYSICELIDSDLNVEVTDVKKHNESFIIVVVIKYNNYSFIDTDFLLIELRNEVKKFVPVIKIESEDSINTFPEEKRQW